MAINWYTNIESVSQNTWKKLWKTSKEFKFLQHENKIVTKIYNNRKDKHVIERDYNRMLKELFINLEKTNNWIKKRQFIEGLIPSFKRKVKVIPASLYNV